MVRRYNSDIFYHYTDFQALDGILRCAQLRVNNVLRMNDSAEMRHFMKRLCTSVAERLEAELTRLLCGRVPLAVLLAYPEVLGII